ncbi:MAG: hypothetical protein JXA15_12030 [Spirochaetales bacterium]|nr:hypothetical protein [Spirochaetales bacterium]
MNGAWPSLAEYNAALLSGGAAILDGALAGASPALNGWGQPSPISGGFAFTYRMSRPGAATKALRLFHSGASERRDAMAAAYRAVASARREGPLARFLVGARWVERCVRAGGVEAPGVVMDWVDAPTLGAWLEKAHADPDALEALRGELSALQDALEGEALVHGDVQTGNLAVARGTSLVLLDYDAFRAEDERDRAHENGHVHFRHPDSDPLEPGPVDRFPLLALDLGLASLAADPTLFARCEGENVYWRNDDYADPDSSPAFAAVSKIPALARAASLFAEVCKGPADSVPSLAEFRAAAGLSDPGPARASEKDRAGGEKGNSAASAAPSAAVSVGTGLDGFASPPQSRGAGMDAGAAPGRPRKPRVRPDRGGKRGYVGQYPVLDPRGLSAVEDATGSKVELVGRVVSVKEGRTKYGKPYAFVNFSDWRGDGIKLIYWSEGLEAVGASAPDASWMGRWLSATGLVDEPYENLRFGTTQYSITILSGSQVRLLDEAEASRRLASGASGASAADEGEAGQTPSAGAAGAAEAWTATRGSNAAFVADRFGKVYDAVSRPGGRGPGPDSGPSPSSPPPRAGASGSAARPSNAELLAELADGPKAAGPAPARTPRPSVPAGPGPGARPASPAPAPAREGLPAGCIWAMVIAIALFIFWAMGR